jgi:hypothetical protein
MRSSAEPGVSPTLAALAGTRADPVCFTRAADRRDRRGVHIVHADPMGLGPGVPIANEIRLVVPDRLGTSNRSAARLGHDCSRGVPAGYGREADAVSTIEGLPW